jgi:hypothetical protein
MPRPTDRPRPSLLLRSVVFLAIFALVLVVVTNLYLIPAYAAYKEATPEERTHLTAYARLILAVVLFVLFAALVLVFRVGRFFIPRTPPARGKPTEYVDAWAEAGRRMQAPAEDKRDDD